MHAGRKCGQAVKLVKTAIGQPETILNTFNPGIDVFATNATADATSGTDVYIQRTNLRPTATISSKSSIRNRPA